MNKKMSPDELRREILNFLREHKSASLGTCLDNVPRCSPVQYFLGNDMDIYILSAGGEKFKAIERNPRVCLLVNTEYINYRKIKGVQIFGKAVTSISNKDIITEAKMYAPDPHILEYEDLKVIKIMPEEIVYLDSTVDGDRTKQVLKKDEVFLIEDMVSTY